jgi:hypothetical protein
LAKLHGCEVDGQAGTVGHILRQGDNFPHGRLSRVSNLEDATQSTQRDGSNGDTRQR